MFRKIIPLTALLIISSLMLSACGQNGSSDEKSSSSPSFSVSETIVPDESSEVSQVTPESSVQEKSEQVSEPSVEEKSETVSEPSVEEKSETVSEPSVEEKSETVSEPSVEEKSETVSEPSVEETSKTSSLPTKEESSKQEFIDVTGIKMNATDVTIAVGRKFRIYCTLTPDNATNPEYVWHVSGTNIIDLQPNGTVTGKAVGTATVTAETYNGLKFKTTFTVTEAPPPPEITGVEVSEDWFDDAVFVGDSVTNALYNFSDENALGDAEFIPSVGIGYHTALWDLNAANNLHPTYYGKKMLMEDAIAASGKNKLFVMMGMNDFSWSIDSTEQCMREFFRRVEQKCPGIRIYVQSVTPLISSIKRNDALNNTNIAIFNERIKNFCLEQGYVYVDVASAVEDGNGNLRDDLCYDPNYMGLHPNKTGCKVWIDYLKNHVE